MSKLCCNRDDKVLAFILYKEHLNSDKKERTKSNREMDKIYWELLL